MITTIHYSSTGCSNSASFPLKQSKNNGITYQKNGMPQKFSGADGGTSFAIGRLQYVNTDKPSNITLKELYDNKPPSCSYVIGRQITTRCNRGGKPFNIESSDQYIQRKKNQAIGKGTMPGQTEDGGSTVLSFKTQTASNNNTIRAAVRKCRSGGCVAPAKKAARPACI